jgi:hypothetical protein
MNHKEFIIRLLAQSTPFNRSAEAADILKDKPKLTACQQRSTTDLSVSQTEFELLLPHIERFVRHTYRQLGKCPDRENIIKKTIALMS